MFHPLAFSGGFATAAIAYSICAAVYFSTRQKLTSPSRWVLPMTCAAIVVMNGVWMLSPHLLSRPVVFLVTTHNGAPVEGAIVKFTFKDSVSNGTRVVDSSGQITVAIPWMETVEGTVFHPEFSEHGFYIAPVQRNAGLAFSIIQQTRLHFVGNIPPIHGMFLYRTSFVWRPTIEIYLQKIGQGHPLPFKAISNLPAHVKEAQQRDTSYPIILSSGDTFNPEMKAQSLDAYLQLSGVLAAYEENGPLRHYAVGFATYFSGVNQVLQDRLDKISQMPEDDPNKLRNATILASLFGYASPGASTREMLDRVGNRLESDRRLLKSTQERYQQRSVK